MARYTQAMQYITCHRLRFVPMAIWVGFLLLASVVFSVRPSHAMVEVNLRDLITSERVFANLSFTFPISMTQLPGDDTHWYLAEQGGRIVRFRNEEQVDQVSVALDLTQRVGESSFEHSQQWGVTAIALHAGLPESGPDLFVAMNVLVNDDDVTSFVSRFRSSDGGQTFDIASEEVLFSVPQQNLTHHLGQLAFGPDGYLYVGFGDGSTNETAQDLTDLRGSILRVDVNTPNGYTIPADNPLIGMGGREEIFIWGLRNPWRFSLDRVTGILWAGDVGGNDREEVNRGTPGGNYGWPIVEGSLCPIEPCDTTGFVPPVLEYDHTNGTAVIGGYVYRGEAIPAIQGLYIFSDWTFGKELWTVLYDAEGQGKLVTLGFVSPESGRIGSFAEDNQGELYHLSPQEDDAAIYKIISEGSIRLNRGVGTRQK